MPNGSDVANQMLESAWTRSGEVEFSAQLRTWRDARELLAAAMKAALVPFLPYWLGAFDSAQDSAAADQQRVGELQLIFDAWAAESHPEWYAAVAYPLPAGVSAPTGS